MKKTVKDWAEELQSLSQAGLFYSKECFDQERYERIREIAYEMMACADQVSLDTVHRVYKEEYGYQTPKIDTRAVVFHDDKLLLVKETSGRWVIPGGWCEFNLTPVENTIKEAKEEAGLNISVKKLLFVHDRERHCTPPYPFHIIKMFFLCEDNGGTFQVNNETVERGYFGEEELPEIAEEKVGMDQIHLCFAAHRDPAWQTRFE